VSESNIQSRPVISVAVRPRADDDRENLQRALSDLTREDPTIRTATGPTAAETTISGMGELHLEMICYRLSHEYGIQIDVGAPKVIYLETIRKQTEAEGRYIRQTSGRGNYAHVKVRLEPLEPGSGYQFANEIADDTVPPYFVEPVSLGIQEAMKGGVLAGHEMIDLRAVLFDGSYHVEDSNKMAFMIAASMAFKEAARRASPVILEPVMLIEVSTPEDFVGTVMGDLSSRRGRIEGMEHHVDSQLICAIAPLAEMIGYAKHMRSITQGRASCSMRFARYEVAPHRGESGGDEVGVTANKPKSPKAGNGFAAAQPDEQSD
jgi:elongation factor G